jgi:methionyl-tRNA formyltransferase
MNGDTTTGISVQTLDHKHFDSGRILAQTRPKGLTIPSPSKITYFGLHEFLKGRAAEMLVQSLQDKVFIPPIYDLGWYHEFALSNSKELVHATKISPADRQIDWYDFSPEKIDRYHRALGRLWSDVQVDGKTKKRVIFEDFEIVTMPPFLREWFRTLESSGSNGRPIERSMDKDVRFFVYERDMSFRPQIYFPDEDKAIILANPTNPKSCIRVREVTVEGGVKKPAYRALREFKHWEVWDLSRDRTGVFKVDSKEEG